MKLKYLVLFILLPLVGFAQDDLLDALESEVVEDRKLKDLGQKCP